MSWNKSQEQNYIETIGKLLLDKKKKDKLIKERKQQMKEYRSISALRKREVSYEEPNQSLTPRYLRKV